MKKTLISALIISLGATAAVASAYAGMESRGQHFMGKKVFSLIDSNDDGSLSKEEVNDFHTERFNKMDADSDGLVTQQEMKAFRKKQRFMRMDSNGDGVITEDGMARSRQSHHKSGRGAHH